MEYTTTDLAELLTTLARSEIRWSTLARFPGGERWWTRLHHTDDADIWLLTWLTGHHTDLHDHGGSAGAFTVVSGELTEVRITADRCRTRRTIIAAGETSRISPTTVHDVYNAGPAAAISLHAYSPPLTKQTYFELTPAGYQPVRERYAA